MGYRKLTRGRFTAAALLCAALCLFGGCTGTPRAEDATQAARSATLTEGASGMEYSARTVILTLAQGTTDAQVEALAAEHGMEVLYLMHNLSMCALSLPAPATEQELSVLLADLERTDFVLSASRDYIIHLDDPL